MSNFCIARTENCLSYSSSADVYGNMGLCRTCATGFMLLSGRCTAMNCGVSTGTCSSCPINFQYRLGVCVANSQQNCGLYNNGLCSLCQYGFYLTQNGGCSPIQPNCLTTYPTGRCGVCRDGYQLYLERCLKSVVNCADYNSNDDCTNCISTITVPTVLINKQCGLLVGQCATLSPDLTCKSCNFGYTLITQ